jgi:uracil-DNA glycosylase family 4
MKTAAKMAGCEIPKFFITNIVACRPTNEPNGKNREPMQWEAVKCSDRLLATIRDVRARRTILLGKIAKTYAQKLIPDAISLVHPAYILRIGGLNSPVFTGFARDIAQVFKDLK